MVKRIVLILVLIITLAGAFQLEAQFNGVDAPAATTITANEVETGHTAIDGQMACFLCYNGEPGERPDYGGGWW